MKNTTIRTVTTLMILLFPFIALKAQEQPATLKRNTVYFELFGKGVLYSFNYEYRIIQQVSLRAGFTSWRISLISTRFNFTGFPSMLNFLSGKKNGHFEAGIGCIPATVIYIGNEYNPFIVLESKGSSTAIGLQLCEEAAFGAQNCQHCTKVDAR